MFSEKRLGWLSWLPYVDAQGSFAFTIGATTWSKYFVEFSGCVLSPVIRSPLSTTSCVRSASSTLLTTSAVLASFKGPLMQFSAAVHRAHQILIPTRVLLNAVNVHSPKCRSENTVIWKMPSLSNCSLWSLLLGSCWIGACSCVLSSNCSMCIFTGVWTNYQLTFSLKKLSYSTPAKKWDWR